MPCCQVSSQYRQSSPLMYTSGFCVVQTDSELQELCGDQLSTVGLRAAAWESVVTTLLERGTPQARPKLQGAW